MKYHIKIMRNSNGGECTINLNYNELLSRYVSPYLNGEDIMINGTIIESKMIYKIKIAKSKSQIDELLKQIEYENSQHRGLRSFFSGNPKWIAIDNLEDVTDQFINKIPKNESIVTIMNTIINNQEYINLERLEELKVINNPKFDLSKLIKLCEEMNSSWMNGNYFSVVSLLRTILHHIPPIFSVTNFEQVANNYNGGTSFNKVMLHLFNSLKNIADIHLHSQINIKETLPNSTQVDYRSQIDLLLSEIIKRLN